jgi:hypothetical protein
MQLSGGLEVAPSRQLIASALALSQRAERALSAACVSRTLRTSARPPNALKQITIAASMAINNISNASSRFIGTLHAHPTVEAIHHEPIDTQFHDFHKRMAA